MVSAPVIRLALRAALLLSLCTLACESKKPRGTVASSGQALVVGRVRTEDGSELKEVRVRAGEKTVRTDAKGYFEISIKAGDEQRVAVDSEDFAGGEVVLKLSKDSKASVELSVLSVQTFKVDDAERGGRFEDPDGFVIELPGKSLRHGDGTVVKGEAELRYATVRDPRLMRVPPEQRAVTKEGRETQLSSKGGLFELRFYKNAERLKLEGTAQIEMPLPPGSSLKSDDRVALYHYDEQSRRFKEEAEAVVEGGKWKATLDKFSWWSAAEEVAETSCVRLALRTPDDEPAEGVVVHALGRDTLFSASASVDAAGQVCLAAPAGSALQLSAYDGRDRFSEDTRAGDGAAACGDDDGCLDLGERQFGTDAAEDAGMADATPTRDAEASVGADFQRLTTSGSVSAPGAALTFSFAARGGERLAYNVTSRASQVADVRVLEPSGELVSTSGIAVLSGTSGYRDTFQLPPGAGTYTVEIAVRTGGTGSFDLDLFPVPLDVLAPIDVDGPAAALAIPSIGQNASLTFAAQGGERLALSAQSSADGVSDIEVLAPDDARVSGAGGAVLAGGSLFSDQFTLPAVAGEYRVVVNPRAQATGNFSLRLFRVPADLIVTGAIDAANGGSLTIAAVAQNGEYRFPASGGERLAYTVTSTATSVVDVTLVTPAGQPLSAGGLTVLANSGGFKDLFTLPTVAGNYALRVDPRVQGTGTITLQLFSVPADINVDGALGQSGVVTIANVGQAATYRFAASRGARLSYTVTSTASSVTDLVLLDPSGQEISALGASTVLAQSQSYEDLFSLPDRSDADTGVYALRLDPRAQGVGSFTLRVFNVPAPSDVPLTPSQPSSSIVSVPGQIARFSLTLPAGQAFQYVVSRSGSSTADVTLLDPAQVDVTPTGRSFLNAPSLTVPGLTAQSAGVYTIQVDPRGEALDTYQVTLTLQ